LFDFTTVRVEDSVEHVTLCRSRRLEPQQLIEADARLPVTQLANRVTGQLYPPLRLDDDKVIAKTMHFCERDAHRSLPVNGVGVLRLYRRHRF